MLRALGERRTGWLSAMARGIDRVATGWTMFFVAMALIAFTASFHRWRHLFTFFGSIVALAVLGQTMINGYDRTRPDDVTIAGRWQGYSFPSATAAIFAFTTIGIIYMTVVPGRPRNIAKRVGTIAVGLVVASRLYLAIDHPSDALAGGRPRRCHPADRVPLLHAERGVPGRRTGGARPRTSTSADGAVRPAPRRARNSSA